MKIIACKIKIKTIHTIFQISKILGNYMEKYRYRSAYKQSRMDSAMKKFL